MAASPVRAGQVLAGKYRIERVLGEGGMGIVVEAYDTSLERRVAIKFLLPEYAKHPEATLRFMREARAAAKIQSEHVARVIDVSKLDTGSPYMVMEFLEGSDLEQVIDAAGPLPMEDAALYVIQACEALAEAHAHGIIHRDLKPANLFLAQQAGGSRKIKVLDFGISKALTATDPALLGSLTRASTMMGSPLYMSPEQMKSARDVDLRTDIWALGVILYESLTAQTPFTGTSIPELSAKILLEDPRPLALFKPDLPQGLIDVVARALRKQPELRFPNVGELAMALLPFAPNRARNNVERIIRVLSAAGLTQGEFQASLAPGDQKNPIEILKIQDLAPTSSAQLWTLGKKKQATQSNFGQTQTERAPYFPSGSLRRRVAVATSLLTLLGVLGLALRSQAPAAPPGPALAAAAPIPDAPGGERTPTMPSAAQVELAALTVIEAPPASARVQNNAPPSEARASELGGASAPAGSSVTSPASIEPRRTLAAGGAKKTRRTRAAPPARAGLNKSSGARTYTGDFKAKFGSRK
jgi:serine/threonine-protein kinase